MHRIQPALAIAQMCCCLLSLQPQDNRQATGCKRAAICHVDTIVVQAETELVREYKGAVAHQSRALASIAKGGQVICDAASLVGIRSHLTELHKDCLLVTTQALSGLAGCA